MSRAEDIARAFHEAAERIDAKGPGSVGGPGTWEDLDKGTRELMIAAMRELLADGIIIALPAPQITVNVHGSTVSEADLMKAIRRGMDGRGRQR